MKNLAIYSTISILLIVVVIFGISGQFVPMMISVVLGALLYASAKTKRGRKWWRTWYRVGIEFDLFLKGQVNK